MSNLTTNAVGKRFKKAEESFLAATRGESVGSEGRVQIMKSDKPWWKDKMTEKLAMQTVTKLTTVRYFQRILTDEMECKLWQSFITAKDPDTGEALELNPVSLKAFLRAVEYKRGMPVTVIRQEESAPGQQGSVQVTFIGATPDFFESQAKAKGLLGGKQ
jgi:hypothetical protein